MAENNVNEEVVKQEQPKKKKTVKQPEKLSMSQKRKILKDAEAAIINNSGAFVFYKDNNMGVEIELPSYGDRDIVEVEVLRRMAVKSKDFFEKYWILVTDVICDDDRIELEDVYEYLGISKYYKGMDVLPSGDFFDDLLLEDSASDFRKYVKNLNSKLMTQLCNRAIVLYQEGKFDSSQKINIIEEKINREHFFDDIKMEQ